MDDERDFDALKKEKGKKKKKRILREHEIINIVIGALTN